VLGRSFVEIAFERLFRSKQCGHTSSEFYRRQRQSGRRIDLSDLAFRTIPALIRSWFSGRNLESVKTRARLWTNVLSLGYLSLLLRDVSRRRVSAFGLMIPSRPAQWFARFWISAVIVGSLLPGSAKVRLHVSEIKTKHSRNLVSISHRWTHIVTFGSSFLVLSLLAAGKREELKAAGEIMIISCVVELAQYFVYSHRQVFEWWDVRDDAIGIVAAFLLLQIVKRLELGIGSSR